VQLDAGGIGPNRTLSSRALIAIFQRAARADPFVGSGW